VTLESFLAWKKRKVSHEPGWALEMVVIAMPLAGIYWVLPVEETFLLVCFLTIFV